MDQNPQSAGSSQSPLAPQMTPNYSPPPAKKPFPWARLAAVLLALALFGSLMVNFLLGTILGLSAADSEAKVQEKYFSHNKSAHAKVAVFSIEGTIIGGEGFFKRQIDHARKDAEDGSLKAIVLRVNSPGGTVTGSDYMLHHLRKLREDYPKIPIVVSMGGIAASGGYYVSMAVGDTEKSIFAEPTTWTGSIGVIIPHYDHSEFLNGHGVKEDSIASGELKGMGSIARPMTDDERGVFDALVQEAFGRFKAIIRDGRPQFKKHPEALDALATGQVFTAEQAKKNGLVDEIGFLEDAVDRAIELAGLDKDNVCVVKYKPEPTLLNVVFGDTARSRPAFDLAALLDATAPRAFYLCTWLPPITGSAKP
jgi:protease IV